jgi:hypothetical protein
MSTRQEDRLEAALRGAPAWVRRWPPLLLNLVVALIAYAIGRLSAPENWVEMRNGDVLETRTGQICWVYQDGSLGCRKPGP